MTRLQGFHTWLRPILTATVLILSLSISACSPLVSEPLSVNSSGNYAPTPRDKVQDGGTLTLPINSITPQQNRFHANVTLEIRSIWYSYNPQLYLATGSGEAIPHPAYLSDVKHEDIGGKTRVTYSIVDAATFNDGTPIDWRAFKTTWKFNSGEIKDAVPNSTEGFKLIESVTPGATDKQAVVTYTGIYPFWEGVFPTLLHPSIDTADKFNTLYLNQVQPDLGAGPFKVEKVDFKTGRAIFVRNEKWWGNPAKLDKIIYKQMETTAATNAFRAGEIDSTNISSKDRFAPIRGMGDAIDIRGATRNFTTYYTLNSQAEILSDLQVRKGIITAIDRAQIATIRFNGLGYSEPVPGSIFAFPFQDWYEDNYGSLIQYDSEEAKRILEAAGWIEGKDGIREKNSKRLSIRYVSFSSDSITAAADQAFQKMLKDVGVEIKIDNRPNAEFASTMKNKDFEIIFSGSGGGDALGVSGFGQLYLSDSALISSGTGTPELDKKISTLSNIPSIEEQNKLANELEKEFAATYGILPITNGPDIAAMKKGLVNYGPATFGVLAKEDIGWLKK